MYINIYIQTCKYVKLCICIDMYVCTCVYVDIYVRMLYRMYMCRLDECVSTVYIVCMSAVQCSRYVCVCSSDCMLIFCRVYYIAYLSLYFIYNSDKSTVYIYMLCDSIYDYIIIFKGLQLDLACLNTYKEYQKSAKWINIYTDNPFNLKFASCSNYEVLNSVKFYDFFCTFYRNQPLH